MRLTFIRQTMVQFWDILNLLLSYLVIETLIFVKIESPLVAFLLSPVFSRFNKPLAGSQAVTKRVFPMHFGSFKIWKAVSDNRYDYKKIILAYFECYLPQESVNSRNLHFFLRIRPYCKGT